MVLVCAAAGGWAVLNWQWIKDSYTVHSSDVQAEATALQSQLGLTPHADFIFKASRPEVQDSTQFNKSCANVHHEQSIVLGCYTAQRFYIFDVDDERLAGVKEVTAAHELLHAVYERLSTREKERLDALLTTTAAQITSQRFIDTLGQYEKTQPSQITNELHSILGTEIQDLPPELEAHYARYFTNRKQIVAYAVQYESTFTALESDIEKYDTQLADLAERKGTLEASLEQAQRSIASEQSRLNQLRESDNITEYNAAVPDFNTRVRNYNADIVSLKAVIEEYNTIVEKRNSLATTQSDLVHELNSNFQSL